MSRLAGAAVFLVAAALIAVTGAMSAQTPAAAVPDEAAPLFDDARLEDIQLLIHSRDWNTLKANYRANTYYPADFQWRDRVVRNVGIRSRGNGSRSGDKPGLRIDFNRYSTGQTFLGLKSLVLRNNTQDPSHLHERLSMRFFARMGLPAPRELPARLFVNNAYAGLYTVVEAIDRAFLRRTFGEDEGYLFDYAYEMEAPPYYFEDRGRDPSRYVPAPFSPETHEADPRPEIVERLVYAINSGGAAQFRGAIEEFLDVHRFVRYVAVETFLAEQDGFLGDWGMNNFYLYRPPQSHRFVILPWDKSHAFVRGPESSIWRNITDVPDASRNRLVTRLLEHPDLRDLFLDTLVDAARSAVAVEPPHERGWLDREIDRQLLQVRGAEPFKSSPPGDFLEAVESLRAFARERPARVVAEVARARGARTESLRLVW